MIPNLMAVGHGRQSCGVIRYAIALRTLPPFKRTVATA